jgi:general secretion pathway protein M
VVKLAKREKALVGMAAGCLAVFILFQFLIFPLLDSKERMERGIKTKEAALKEVLTLSAEYQAQQKGTQDIAQALSSRKKGFTLFSFLDEAAGAANVKSFIKYMKPSTSPGTGAYQESTVEMKLEGITLEQLMGYVYRIESPNDLVNIRRVTISENKKETGYLDAVLQVFTFQ